MRHIIFDWSGTIVDDLPPVIEATNAVLAHAGRPQLSREDFRRQFKLPYTKFYEEVTPHVPLDELEVVFRAAFAASQQPVTILPHAREFLEFAAARGRLFVLSSAPEFAVVEQAEHMGIRHYFERFHAGIKNKAEYIRHLLDEHALTREETLMVGDMIHDVETARTVGVFSVAVLTGYDFPEVLATAEPDLTVPDLSHLRHWLEHRTPPAESPPLAS